MKYLDLYKKIEELAFEERLSILKISDTEIYLIRPLIPTSTLKNKYEKEKNFQIWIKEGDREFKPNHLRVMLDLNLRIRSRPDLKQKLCLAFDDIFYGKDPLEAIDNLKNEQFDHLLNSIEIIATLSQLFIIEQEFNYTGESKFEPKTLFFQGWVREFIDSPKEIDNMCMSVCNGQPPKTQYTDRENKKHKKFEEHLTPLWYLNNN